ncbi:MAG TPA: MliC family protein [Casimicrobiaceae bacterium]
MRTRRIRLYRFGVALSAALVSAAGCAAAAGAPSFDCSHKLNAAQKLVCGDDTLAALDHKLGDVFSRAAKAVPRDKYVAYFVAEQRDWMRNRDGCPQTPNPAACLSSVYRTRIAQLQDQFNMVPSRGPFRWRCDGSPAQEFVVTWYATDPPSGVLESAHGQTTMFAMASASGTRYIGDDVAFAEHDGTASVAFGTAAQELACTLEK